MGVQHATKAIVVDESNVNARYVWRIAFIAAMGGLLFGYDFMVIGGTTIFYEAYFGITGRSDLLGLSVASFPVGCILGAACSMFLADRFGRKTLLIWSSVFFAASAFGTAIAWDFLAFNLFRALGGIGVGLAANLSPMYIAEVSPASYRGKVVTTNQLTIMVGIVVSQVVNLLIQQAGEAIAAPAGGALSWNELYGWRLMFGAEFIPALAFFALMFTVPRSPRWLMKRGRREEAERVMTAIGGPEYARKEVADIASTLSREEVGRVNFREIFEPRMLKVVLLGMFLAVVQQWSGLNSVFAYSHQIFESAGVSVSGTMLALVFQGLTMLVFCILAMFIVDRVGRKVMMLAGALGIAITHLLIGLSFHFERSGIEVVLLVLLAIALYATTLAPVVWVLLSELFPNRVRGVALGLSVVALWTGYLILTYTFPIMQERLGIAETFWVYAAFLVVAFLVMWVALPETKGKSLEEIEREILGYAPHDETTYPAAQITKES